MLLDQSPQSPNVLSVLTMLSPSDLAAKLRLLQMEFSVCSCQLHSSRNGDLFCAAKDSNNSQDSVCLFLNCRKWDFILFLIQEYFDNIKVADSGVT